ASAATVYPTLQLLEDLDHVRVADSEGKRVYHITPAGEAFLEQRRDPREDVFEWLRGAGGALAELGQAVARLASVTYRQAYLLARALAGPDARYNGHWSERLGHLLMFEARPGTGQATRLLVDAACEWLRERGAEAARAGFGMLEFPFVVDDYVSLPPSILRHN